MYRRNYLWIFSPLLILCINLHAVTKHPFYLSVTEIEYFPKNQRVGISIKLFSDDLENAINENAKVKIDIIKGNKSQNNVLLKTYIQEHFSIAVNGQQKIPAFLGYEIDKDATWIFLELNAQNIAPKLIRIQSDLLYDQHHEQINIFHSVINGIRLSKKLTFPENLCEFKY